MEIIRGKQPGAKKTVIYGPEGIGKSKGNFKGKQYHRNDGKIFQLHRCNWI